MKPLDISILEFDTVESTNLTAKSLFKKGKKEGTFVTARQQSGGRGSQSRTWFSPVGGLYMSGLLRAKSPAPPTTLSIVAGIAVSQTLRTILPNSSRVSVKWPNDCLVGNKKVAGVLSEVLEDAENPLCVVGIGINVNIEAGPLAQFDGNRFPATSLQIESANTRYPLDRVTNTLLLKIKHVYELYWKEGFTSVAELWESNCLEIGVQTRFRLPPTQPSGKPREVIGRLHGIDPTGGIVLSNEKGELTPYFVGEIDCFLP